MEFPKEYLHDNQWCLRQLLISSEQLWISCLTRYFSYYRTLESWEIIGSKSPNYSVGMDTLGATMYGLPSNNCYSGISYTVTYLAWLWKFWVRGVWSCPVAMFIRAGEKAGKHFGSEHQNKTEAVWLMDAEFARKLAIRQIFLDNCVDWKLGKLEEICLSDRRRVAWIKERV